MNQKNEACYEGLVKLFTSGTREFLVYMATLCTLGYVVHMIVGAASQVETTGMRVAIITGCIPLLIVSVVVVWFGSRKILRQSDHNEDTNTDAESEFPP